MEFNENIIENVQPLNNLTFYGENSPFYEIYKHSVVNLDGIVTDVPISNTDTGTSLISVQNLYEMNINNTVLNGVDARLITSAVVLDALNGM